MKYEEMKFGKLDDVIKAYDSGQCDVFTADVSQLYALRLKLAKPGRPRHPARRHLQGAAGAGGAAARRRLADDREVDAIRDDQRRGARRHLEEHRRGAEVEEARRDAAGRHRRRLRRGARPDQGLGRAHHPPGRQLRRSLRAQCRRGIEAGHSARPQPALERRRHPVRAADHGRCLRRHCGSDSDEAIQYSPCGLMDCFAEPASRRAFERRLALNDDMDLNNSSSAPVGRRGNCCRRTIPGRPARAS